MQKTMRGGGVASAFSMSLIDTVCDMSFDLGLLPTALQGSSLEPAAGFTSPSASTRPRDHILVS
jgi:hypothetical protein